MKHLLILLLMLVAGLSSCKKAVEGESVPPAFGNYVHFSSDGSIKTIVAKNNVVWGFYQFCINDKYPENDELKLFYKDGPEDIWNVYKVEGEWFSVERVNYKIINIMLKENKTNEFRQFNFLCYRGNSWTQIFVTQQ